MFQQLSNRFEGIVARLRSRGVLSEEDVDASLKDVRLALLEADVHFRVVKDFLVEIRQKAMGLEARESLSPGQQVIKIVWEGLCRLLGSKDSSRRALKLSQNPPTYLMLVGLQGSGKTTTAAKLALKLKGEGRRVLLTAADINRPAAIEQLSSLGEQIGVDVHTPEKAGAKTPLETCLSGARRGREGGYDLVIFDTAGRQQIDEHLMDELSEIKRAIVPHENLLVVDAMTGQQSVTISERFHQAMGLTGVILTKLDGDARGGALLSIKSVTGLPVRYLGVGEKVDALEDFYPERMASRILGMGDVLSLIERAEKLIPVEKQKKQLANLTSGSMTLEDFRDQIVGLKKMGSMEQILGMLPGTGKIRKVMNENSDGAEKELVKVEAIIGSMTRKERKDYSILNGSRRRRIAKGSGTTVEAVNRLLRQFLEARKMMKKLSRKKGKSGFPQLLRTF